MHIDLDDIEELVWELKDLKRRLEVRGQYGVAEDVDSLLEKWEGFINE